jgi:dephospho-CoA kinase
MNKNHQFRYICITGSIACGKSLAGYFLKELHPATQLIEADEIVHRLLENDNKIIARIVKTFGKSFLSDDGNIDRKKLGSLVFKDSTARRKLERILHPPVIQIIKNWKEDIAKNNKPRNASFPLLAAAIIPLVFEGKYTEGWDCIVCVAAPASLQMERLIRERNLSKEEAILRINSQLPVEEKMKLSDYVIVNTGNKNFLKEQVAKLLTRIF